MLLEQTNCELPCSCSRHSTPEGKQVPGSEPHVACDMDMGGASVSKVCDCSWQALTDIPVGACNGVFLVHGPPN